MDLVCIPCLPQEHPPTPHTTQHTEYLESLLKPAGLADTQASSITGHGLSFMVGRLSFTFDLTGPCVSTDTACSSSLVALHLGRLAVAGREASCAVAAGVNLMLSPVTTGRICMLRALSPVGRCQTLDAEGAGYGRGEGVAVLRLDGLDGGLLGAGGPADRAADRAADRVSSPLALVRGSGVNQDGRSSSLTSPSGPSQASLFDACFQAAGLAPSAVAAVSMHGTGTALGDPIEVGALGAALRRRENPARPVHLGSSKAALGHTEGTAGVAGLLLAAHALAARRCEAMPGLTALNPFVLSGLAGFAASRQPGAGVGAGAGAAAQTSSFGMSGVNATALVQAAFDAEREVPKRPRAWRPATTLVLVAPAAHPLLSAPLLAHTSQRVTWHVDLDRPVAAPARECAALGRPAFVAGVVLEVLAAAAATTLAAAATPTVVALQQVANLASLLHPALSSPESRLLLEVSCDSVAGTVACRGARGAAAGKACRVWPAPTVRAHTPAPSTRILGPVTAGAVRERLAERDGLSESSLLAQCAVSEAQRWVQTRSGGL